MKKKFLYLLMAFSMILSSVFTLNPSILEAATTVDLKSIEKVSVDGNVATIEYNDGLVGKMTFLDGDIFRFHIDPTGKFNQYATPSDAKYTGRIQIREDSSSDYSKPTPTVSESGGVYSITVGKSEIKLNKSNAVMSIVKDGKEILTETEAIKTNPSGVTEQKLKTDEKEQFYGGGTQNGYFAHKGTKIKVEKNPNVWTNGYAASPNPFYWSTNGYGVLRNTFKPGAYDFGAASTDTVVTQHTESQYDSYYFLGDNPTEILQGYFKVTGNPLLLPEYSYYVGHLNCFNRDDWAPTDLKNGTRNQAWETEDGSIHYEYGMASGYVHPLDENGKIPASSGLYPETLNGTSPLSDMTKDQLYKYSASAVIDGYSDHDMPLGYLLPNDGYGCGYGQTGYYEKSTDKTVREKAVDANVANLKEFTDYANKKGVQTGLWTQSALTPDTSYNSTYGLHTLRDFNKEVNVAGIRTLKTDVAWVGAGLSMALDATRQGFEGIAKTNTRPNVISLNGWAGTQRHANIWSGDQYGDDWEYIRFHIPTYIGQGLSGNPNVASDIDGIWGGNELLATRDIQWKTFTPVMLEMDGWGNLPKKPYIGKEDNKNINRMYLKLKAQLMPYLYTAAEEAVTGLPMIRAMFLEYPEDMKAHGTDVQYQFMYGSDFLVAPVYRDTQADAAGNDVRNNIYLPDENEVWQDYFTGEKYQGGQTLNHFDAPLWKLPLFVKSGAIVPMYEDHNNPIEATADNVKGLDKSQRLVEFFPSEKKESAYTSYEDDGMYIDAVDAQGNEKADVTYGGSVKTVFTSKVDNGTAILEAGKSTGNYTGYDADRNTSFIVNLTKEPSNVKIYNGSQQIDNLKKATSQTEFDTLKANGEGTYYYNPTPNLNTYSQGSGEFANKEITTTPKLYVNFPKANVQANAQKVVIEGYENKDVFSIDQLNNALAAPQFEEVLEDDVTPTSIKLNWNKIDDATSYEMMIDNEFTGGFKENDTSFLHEELEFKSTHTYKIRARNVDGYSEWSTEISAESALDPWRNVPDVDVTWPYGDQYGKIAGGFDHDYRTYFHSTSAVTPDQRMVLDLKSIHSLDKFAITPRLDNKGNGAVFRMDIYTSMDGVNWKKAWDGNANPTWTYDKNDMTNLDTKTVDLTNIKARYLSLSILSSSGGFFSASEISVYKQDGTIGYPIGDVTKSGKIDDNADQFVALNKGAVQGDATFDLVYENQGDINMNGVFDVYDYSYVMNQLEGGTQKTGKPNGTVSVDVGGIQQVKAGEKITMVLNGHDLENINSLGSIFTYDADKYKLVEVKGADAVKNMVDLSATSIVGNKETVTISFNNRGDKALLSGNHEIATVVLEAKVDTDVIIPEKFMLIGPKYDVKTVDVYRSDDLANKTSLKETIDKAEKFLKEEEKLLYTVVSWDAIETALAEAKVAFEDEDTLQNEADAVENKLKKALADVKLLMLKPADGISNITFTNDKMTDDDGSSLWQQTNWKTMIFDGNKTGALAEFKWFTTPDSIKAEVKLPTDFNFTFDAPKKITSVKVYNRKPFTSNGVITSIEAKGITTEGETIPLGSFSSAVEVFEFKNTTKGAEDKLFTKVIITPKTSVGKATNSTTGSEENRMLSIYEIEFFAKIALDTSAYDALVAEIEALDLSKYTQVSKEALEQAKETTQKVVDSTNKQADVNQAVTDLRAAKDALVVKPADKPDTTKLEQLVNEVKDKDVSTYTTTSANAFKKALADAKTALDATTQKAVDDAYSALDKANKALSAKADTTNLDALIKTIEEIDLTLYTTASAKDVSDALAEAKAIDKDDASQSAVDAAHTKLLKAKNDLVKKIDKEKLTKLIEEAKAIDTSGYSETSVKTFADALKDAEKALAEATTQKAIDDAYDVLDSAIKGLQEKVVSTTRLNELLAQAKAIDVSKYTDESVAPLQEAIAEAEALLLKRAPATQEEVDAAATKLDVAIKGLVLKAPGTLDKDKLTGLVADAEKINKNMYTKESVAVFEAALAKVKLQLANATTQEEIEAAYSELTAAIAQLKVKEGASNSTQSGAPSTGDVNSTLPYLVLLGGASVFIFRRRENIRKLFNR